MCKILKSRHGCTMTRYELLPFSTGDAIRCVTYCRDWPCLAQGLAHCEEHSGAALGATLQPPGIMHDWDKCTAIFNSVHGNSYCFADMFILN